MLKVNHPNIIRLYEVHESKNSIYLVLEYLKGGELFQRITESEELLSRKEIALIMRWAWIIVFWPNSHKIRDILQGLRYLGKKGILHRDLKPENLIL